MSKLLLNIVGFTHAGTSGKHNEDRILVQQKILSDGQICIQSVDVCRCFVADGIGGNPLGEMAAQFVLEQIVEKFERSEVGDPPKMTKMLENINSELLDLNSGQSHMNGSGTTLIGLIIEGEKFTLLHAGDSQAWLLRKSMFFKVIEDHVRLEFEQNSPLTNYFGGMSNVLFVDYETSLRSIQTGDLILLCSDGLFKSLPTQHVKTILMNNMPICERMRFLLNKVLETGATDNVSSIVIELTHTDIDITRN